MAKPPSLVKDFLGDALPMMIGANYNRPSPAHILNNLVALAVGAGSLRGAAYELVSGGGLLERLTASDPESRDDAVSMFDGLLNADGKVWDNRFSSPFPILGEMAAPDPSDDSYAVSLWNAIGPQNRSRIGDSLSELVAPAQPSVESISELARTIRSAATPAGGTASRTESGSPGSAGGIAIGEVLAVGLEVAVQKGPAFRLEALRQFGVMASAAALLILLYDTTRRHPALAELGTESETSIGEALRLIVYTGETPGTPNRPLVRLAVLSLEDAVRRAHEGVLAESRRLLDGLADEQDLARRITQRMRGDDARELLQLLREGGVFTDPEHAIAALLPADLIRRGVKSMGFKVGLCGPQRKGDPRLLLETGFLTAMVSYICTSSMTLDELIDEVYLRFGLVVGQPRGVSVGAWDKMEALCGQQFDLEQQLYHARNDLQDRLISAGLARRYSDGTTIVEG